MSLWVGTVGGLCPRASILRQPLVTAPPSPSRTNAIIDCQSLKATTNQTTSDKCLINSLLWPPENNDAIALSQSYVAIWLWQQTQTRPILMPPRLIHILVHIHIHVTKPKSVNPITCSSAGIFCDMFHNCGSVERLSFSGANSDEARDPGMQWLPNFK